MRYDLILKQGLVIDPKNNRHGVMDVAVYGGRIAAVQNHVEGDAVEVLDMKGRIVTPGLIDAHVHICELGGHADMLFMPSGVTTVCDAGSTGAANFSGLRELLARSIRTRARAFLNFSFIGLTGVEVAGELFDRRYADAEACVRTIAANRDLLVGVKLRLSPGTTWDPLEALHLASQTATEAGVPLMVHVTNCPVPLPQVVEHLRSGDILSHLFHGFTNGIMNPERTALLEPIWEAQKRGVLFDSAHGRMGHFNFDIARKSLELGFMPNIITTDLTIHNATRGPVFDLVTTMSKFLNLGMSLQDIILRTTARPAELLGLGQDLGHLGVGAIADIAILELLQGTFEFIDTDKNVLQGKQRIVAVSTLREGRICYQSGEAAVGSTSTKPRAVFY